MNRFVLLILLIAIGIVNIALLEAKPPNNGLPLVHADFPVCVTAKPLPLLRTPQSRVDYRLGVPSNDKGMS